MGIRDWSSDVCSSDLLEAPGAGSVAIGGAAVDHLPPAERGIAMVFQSYALYPHMSVRANLELALRMQRLPRAAIRAAVDRKSVASGRRGAVLGESGARRLLTNKRNQEQKSKDN